MSGFEVLGATAAIAQLSELCIKCGQTTVRIICSYRGAPKEIIELAQKVDRLKFRIGQVQKIGDDLSDLDLDDVFPEIHRVILLEQLETHHKALLEIEGLATGVGGQTRGKKLQWAFVDKRKTTRIMQDLADINQTLDQFLEIIPIRLATIQHNSLAALRVSNAAMLPALIEQMKEIQSSIQSASDDQFLYWKETQTKIMRCRDPATAPARITPVLDRPESSTKDSSAHTNRTTNRPPPPSSPQVTTKENSRGLKSGHEFVDTVIEFHNFGMSQPSQHAQWDFGCSSGTGRVTQNPRYSGRVAVKTTASFREVRSSLRVRFFLFNERVLRFELGVRQLTRAWTSFSLVGSRIDVVNIRPYDSRIFQYCRTGNFDGVKMMLEQGQASINDVDEWHNVGLLEHIVTYPPTSKRWNITEKTRLKMIKYLMHQGCTTHCAKGGRIWSTRPPTIIQALRHGHTDIVRFMLQQNVSFDTPKLAYNPTQNLYSGSQAKFHEQISLLHTCGYTDWVPSTLIIRGRDALSGAIAVGSVSDIIYAAEVLKLGDTPPSINSVSEIDVDIAVALEKSTSSLHWTEASVEILDRRLDDTSVQHWILFKECTSGQSSLGDIGWRGWWNYHNTVYKFSWMFSSTVTLLQHLLLHGGSYWNEVETGWVKNPYRIGTADGSAKTWSYFDSRSSNIEHKLDEWACCGEPRNQRVMIDWSDDGTIRKSAGRWASRIDSADSRFVLNPAFSPGDSTNRTVTGSGPGTADAGDVQNHYQRESTSTDGMKSKGKSQWDSSIFKQVISTEEGRRHMSRFPLVKALCCALQLAGYRAEMDDEGDIWFEDEDGDQYFDAVEHPSEHDRRGPLGGTCEMCRDPEKFGLGSIIEQHENAVRKWRHERQIFVERGLLQPLPEDEQP